MLKGLRIFAMNAFFILAGTSAAFTALVHTFLGGKFVARPLLASQELPRVSLYTNYYCWHIVTIVLFSMSGMYFFADRYPESIELAWLATFFAALFVFWNGLMVITHKLRFKRFPQWALISPTAALGIVGLLI
jgi:hypothetical protein